MSAYSGRKVGDHNHAVPPTLISVADINVTAELGKQVDRSPSTAIPYLEGGKSTLRLVGAQSPCSTNLSNESTLIPPTRATATSGGTCLEIAPRPLAGLSMPPLETWQSRQTQPQSQSLLPQVSGNSWLQWQLNMTIPLPDVEGSKAAYPPSVSWESHSKQLG